MSLTPKTLKISVVFNISPLKLFLDGHTRLCSNSCLPIQKLFSDPKVKGRMWFTGVWRVYRERAVQVGWFYEDRLAFSPQSTAAENRKTWTPPCAYVAFTLHYLIFRAMLHSKNTDDDSTGALSLFFFKFQFSYQKLFDVSRGQSCENSCSSTLETVPWSKDSTQDVVSTPKPGSAATHFTFIV